MTNFKFS